MKRKIEAGGRARAIGKLDLEIWAVSVGFGFAVMYGIKQQRCFSADQRPGRLELRSYEVRWSRYRVILSV